MTEHRREVKVRTDTSPQTLAGVVVKAAYQEELLSLLAVGPVAVGHAVKAVAIANRTLQTGGILLQILPRIEERSTSTGSGETPWVVTLLDINEVKK